MKRELNLTFYDQLSQPTHRLYVIQEFQGLSNELDDKIEVKTKVSGMIPSIESDANINYRDHKQIYKHSKPGSLI